MHKISTNSLFVGKKVVHLPKCHSTNAVAAQLLSSGQADEGTVVIADHQTNGRGQRGNSWEAEAGKNLTLSIVLKPAFLTPHQQFFLTIVSSVSMMKLVREETQEVLIKWPNDIYAGNQKVAGILIENSLNVSKIESSIIGIGLNVNQTGFVSFRAASLKQFTGREYLLDDIAQKLFGLIESHYLQLKSGNFAELKQEYLQAFLGLGQMRRFRTGGGVFYGTIEGVQNDGKLIVSAENGRSSYDIKEISFLFDEDRE